MTPHPCRSFWLRAQARTGFLSDDSNDCNTHTVLPVRGYKNGAVRRCGLVFEKLAVSKLKLTINRLSFSSEMWLGFSGENPTCRVSVFAVLQDNAF